MLIVPMILLGLFHFSFASLSESFMNFVEKEYSNVTAERLNRSDLGAGGSFGGGDHNSTTKTKNQPVILVHGITNRADRFSMIREYFLSRGYSDAEIYATTYGDGGITSVLFVTMDCDYVQRIRELIIAVSSYTHSMVDVIGYSMGSPIARKAILGGKCVDTGEDIGDPISHLVDTFLGVAGANFGSFLCVIPLGSCNLKNGLHCLSEFINDINAVERYEGSFIFSIYSTYDDKVGYLSCGKVASAIPGQNGELKRSGLNHDQVMEQTVEQQYNFVRVHKAESDLE